MKSKAGLALAPLHEGKCGGCHMKLIASTVSSVLSGKEITRCEDCGTNSLRGGLSQYPMNSLRRSSSTTSQFIIVIGGISAGWVIGRRFTVILSAAIA